MNNHNDDFAADSAQLRLKVQSLRSELDQLRLQHADITRKLEQANNLRSELEKKCGEIEKKHADFVSLYVAGYQFQPTLEVQKIVQGISEIIINFIGAEHFGIYLFNPDSNQLVPIGGDRGEEYDLQPVPLNDNFLSQVARSGELFVNIDARPSNGDDPPIAAVPLVASDELIGMLTIEKLLTQKNGLDAIDVELLELLKRHASTSLLAVRLYDRKWQELSTS